MSRRILGAPKSKTGLAHVTVRDALREENPAESDDPETAVTKAEARAAREQKRVGSKTRSKIIDSKRGYAEALRRQADILHYSGDYEAALILYHRAAQTYPREMSHSVAARRTAAVISSATNPSRALRKVLSGVKDASQLPAYFCPETAALRARKMIEESPDSVATIHEVLKYFDSRKNLWRDPSTVQSRQRANLLSRSKIMFKQLISEAKRTLQDLQAAFASKDWKRSLKTGEELIVISEPLPNRHRYQIAARHYLAMTQIALKRHDRAVDQVSRMVWLAGDSGDITLRSRSMMTLGRVHLSFGHLEAAARAWEKLVAGLEDAVPKAWLLHEIGRCYFEMKSYSRALETAGRCIEFAEEGQSRKWLLHGKLLTGQSLVELGRLGEALGALRVAGDAAEDEKDEETLAYILNLIDRVSGALRRAVSVYEHGDWGVELSEIGKFPPRRSDDPLYRIEEERRRSGDREKKLHRRREASRLEEEGFTRRVETRGSSSGAKNAGTNGRLDGRKPLRKGRSQRSSTSTRGSSTGSDFGTRAKNDDSSGLLNIGIKDLELNPRELSPRLEGDLDGVGGLDELTSRTRVIRRETGKEVNSSERWSCSGSEILVDEEASSTTTPDEERTNRTGKTYVLDESGKFAKDQSRGATGEEEGLGLRLGNQLSDKSEIIHEPDNSSNGEYPRLEGGNDLVILSARARPRDGEIDGGEDRVEEEEEEDEREGEKYARTREKEEAGGGSSTDHREVFSSCGSELSATSPAQIRLVDNKKTSRLLDMPSSCVDYEESTMCTRTHASPSSSPSAVSPRDNQNERIPTDTNETTDVSFVPSSRTSEDTRLDEYINFASATPRPKETSEEVRDKFNASFSTSFLDEFAKTDFPEIPLLDHLVTRESISAARTSDNASYTRLPPYYRRFLPTSPKEESYNLDTHDDWI